MIASFNAEAGCASNEHAMPAQLIGVIAIEKQALELLELEDQWIQFNISEHQKLELRCLSKQQLMDQK